MAIAKKTSSKKTASKKTPTKAPTKAASPEPSKAPQKDTKTKPSFLKRGAAAREARDHEQAKAEARKKASSNRTFRFYMGVGESHDAEQEGPTVTFLDGDLDQDGCLDAPVVREHEVRVPGKMPDYYVCLSDETGECPICEHFADDEKPNYYRLLSFLTVLDHRDHTIKNGPNRGKTIKGGKKLLALTGQDLEMLQKHATRFGGLRGVQFEVTRGKEQRSAKIGDNWYPLNGKEPASEDEIREAYGDLAEEGVDIAEPLQYDEVLNFLTAPELNSLGFGTEREPSDDEGYDPTDTGDDDPTGDEY